MSRASKECTDLEYSDRSVTTDILLRDRPDEEEDEEDGYDKPEADDEDEGENEDDEDDDGYSE